MRTLLIVTIALLLTGCTMPEKVTVSGGGTTTLQRGRSEPFHLNGGAYRVDWTLTNDNPSTLCGFSARLTNTAGTETHPLGAGELARAEATKSGVTYANDVSPGEYVVENFAVCPWSLVFTKQ